MLRATDSTGKMPDSDNVLSLDRILSLRGEAFARIRMHAAEVATIGNAVESLDTALQVMQADRSSDEMQALVTAARRLAALIDGCEVER